MEFKQLKIGGCFYQLDDDDNFEMDDHFRGLWHQLKKQLRAEGLIVTQNSVHFDRVKWGNRKWSDNKLVFPYTGHYPQEDE